MDRLSYFIVLTSDVIKPGDRLQYATHYMYLYCIVFVEYPRIYDR